MFKDYYSILCIEPATSKEGIKIAFREQARRWHPDKNPGRDTTERMKEINEAYLILSDLEARARYDEEYHCFREQFAREDKSTQATASDYVVHDEILNKWIHNARKQAVEMVKQTLRDAAGMGAAGAKAAFSKVKYYLLVYIILQILFVMFFLVS